MLYDRPYMREPRRDGSPSVVVWLSAAIVAGYLLQNILLRILRVGPAAEALFALSPMGLRSGQVWTLATYAFLHSPDNWLHIICNVLALYFIGKELLPITGPRRFVGLFFACVVLGGAVWAAVNWRTGGYLIGASAGVMGLLIVFACLYPNREVTLLLFFILPVTMKPKYLAIACVALDLFGCAFYELLGNASPMGFAHSAHLGGMAAGWIYFRFVHAPTPWRLPFRRRASVEPPRWMKQKAAQPAGAAPAYRINLGTKEGLKAEVDRILDKINSKGFGSLTPEEKRLLDEAKDMLSKR
jgi:membrane associated rhomboid family serine protease